ncbi:MAG: hypothetical protein R3E50_09025 [Halioglobus sp.]
MQITDHADLFAAIPTQDVLLVATAFSLAALVLFALGLEAGNYPHISHAFSRGRAALRRLCHGLGEGFSVGRRAAGH